MKLFSILFLLAVVTGEALGEICPPPKTPTKLIARRTWPGATTTASQCSSTLSPTTTTMATTTTPMPILLNCSVENPACGTMCTNLTSTGGVVQSPNFPGDYGYDGWTCLVTITAPEGSMIRLNFTTFNVERGIGVVVVYNAFFHGLLPPTSGNTIPASVSPTTNSMLIDFEFDPGSSKPSTAIYNWQATFSVTSQGSSCSVDDPAACGTMCNNVTSAGSGVVQSPNFPGDYGKGYSYCFVTIIVPAGKKIKLKFTTFNLETDMGSVDVMDELGNNFFERATGSTIPSVLTSTSNIMYLYFHTFPSTKPNTTIYNWQATYTAVTV